MALDRDMWAVYRDDRGYTAEPDRGHIVDLGGKIPARRLKQWVSRSLAERLAARYNAATEKARRTGEGGRED